MWWSKTRWILAAILVLGVALANPFRPWSPQQAYYRALSDRHAKLAAECRRLEAEARSKGELARADRIGKIALDHDRQYWMLRRGSYASAEDRARRAGRP